ncbi:MAG: hypothetical protein M1829_006780 [Trizodia sp. TS-e1964]|nr:MAG: hypothetical protein M1829_006780 [Trizodia sp. TS-e1964]
MEQLFTEYLVNSLWQLPLIAGAAWLIIYATRPRLALQHAIWLGALTLMVTLPAVAHHPQTIAAAPAPTQPTATSPSADLLAEAAEILTPHPSLPFQNLNYRAAVRVIDFFPPTLAEFSVRSAHQALSDYSDSEAESIASPPETLTQNPRFAGDKWEWRFYLLVEDASGPAPRARMRLLVAGPDAEYLLKIDAEDLRLDAKALRKLEEKMFFVWGELFEARQASGDKGGSGGEVKNTPFECCIKEYGVKTENVAGEDVWERRFRMFGTTIM